MVVITPNTALPKNRPKDNVTEIDIGHSYEVLHKFSTQDAVMKFKRGVINDVESMISNGFAQFGFYVMSEMFNSTEVNQLLEDKNQTFDLIIAEAIMNFHLIFGKIFNAPVILISSFHGLPEAFETIGAMTRHPILYPHLLRSKFRELTLFEKIREIYYEFRLAKAYWQTEEMENTLLRTRFGDNAPTVRELKNNVCLLFLNTFALFDNNRPVPPSVVYLGALHLQPVKELPEFTTDLRHISGKDNVVADTLSRLEEIVKPVDLGELAKPQLADPELQIVLDDSTSLRLKRLTRTDLKRYLDNSKRGVVYVSLGTNVRPSLMDKELLDAFLKGFEMLPYDVLWKFDGDNVENVPGNVKVQKWFPQRDLLDHPNIKVFVTQGGLQSTDEAIDSGVPLVGIPIIVDQWYNVNRYVELGIGVRLDAVTLTADDLVEAVKRVIADDRQNIKQVKAMMYDQPQRPLERAVWWTEHVLRHGGAKHLRSPAANMSYWEYLMADVLLLIIGVFIIVIFVIVSILYYVINLLKSGEGFKEKLS